MADERAELAELRRLRELESRNEQIVTAPMTMASTDDFRQMGINPTEGMGPWGAFKAKFTEGVQNIGRAAGLENVPVIGGRGYSEQDAYQQFKSQAIDEQFPKSSMTGEIIGEAMPFAVGGAGVGGIASTPIRVGASSVLGAIEGWLVSKGDGGDTDQNLRTAGTTAAAAGILEAVLPIVGRRAGQLYRRFTGRTPSGSLFTPDGIPTDELKRVLNDAGISVDDLTDEAMSVIRRQGDNIDPVAAARQARFETTGVPYTQGDITQDFAQQAREYRLTETTASSAADPMRQMRLDQSRAFTAGVNDMVDQLGVPEEAGKSIKLALTNRLDDLTSKKNVLYKSMAENSPHVISMPVFTDGILDALPDAAEMRRVRSLTGNNMSAFNDLMVEFGINQSEEAVESFTKSGGVVTPLNLGNIEDFRSFLNRLPDGATPGGRATGHWVSEVKKALDGEFDMIDDVLQKSNVTDTSLVEPLKQARAIVSQVKKEYSPQSIIGKLVNKRPDGYTPVTEASDVYKAVVKNKPVEYLERTVKGLLDAGQDGITALRNMQAATVLDAMESALKAPSYKIDGEQVFTYSKFFKELDSLGDDKLKLIFRGNTQGYRQLMAFKETARDLVPTAAAMPKGSAAVNIDIASNVLNRLGNAPGVTQMLALAQWAAKSGSDRSTVIRAINASPAVKQQLTQMQREYPSILSAIGLSGYLNLKDDEQEAN